ncbi:MAG: polysaccharide deacetylase family protein [Terriglobales bacterium]
MFGSVVAASGLSVAAALAYQSISPTAQWYGRTFTGLHPGSKQLALTYDDGPNDPHTLRLLDVLANHDVHATFFLIGRYVRERSDIVREIVQAGHAIGNHTFTHPLLTFQPGREIERQLTECTLAIRDAVGEHSNLFRPPFGGRRPTVLQIARRLGLQPVMWNVTGYDWNARSAAHIQHRVTRRVRGGNVILLHDGGHKQFGADRSRTVAASDKIISRYKSEGLEFVTIPEMIRISLTDMSCRA